MADRTIYCKNEGRAVKYFKRRTSARRVLSVFFWFLLILLGIVSGTMPEPAIDPPAADRAESVPAPDASGTPETTSVTKRDLLSGAWTGGGCTYRIDPDGTILIHRVGAASDSISGKYSWLTMGNHSCITMQRGGNALSLQVYLIGDVTESRAVIALGTPFIRVGEGKGIPGTWKHMDRMSRMEWTLGPDTVDYRRTVINSRTLEEQVTEHRAGTYREAGGKYEDGSFQLSFQDGSRAVALPIVYRNLMYLFDLSPSKSLFTRVITALPDTARISEDVPPEKRPEQTKSR